MGFAIACRPGSAIQPEPDRGASRTALARGTIAITHVSVIPMTSETVIPDATVIVHNGRVTFVGPAADADIPSSATRVDGRGKFLIPGLTDMHAHLLSDGDEVRDEAGPAELGVMLANGITTTRLMMGTPEQLMLRANIAAGKIVGPNLWLASPQLTGRESENALVVTNAEEARSAVVKAAHDGYDFIKITLFITPEVFDAITSESKRLGIRVVGHVDPQVGLARALASGQQLEHLDSFFEAAIADSSPIKESVTQQFVYTGRNWASLDHIDDNKVDSLAGATARAGIFVTPTQNVFNTAFAIGESDSTIRNRPDWDFWPPKMRELYMKTRERYWGAQSLQSRTPARRQRYVEVRNRIVKTMQDSGGRLMAGSDTPEFFQMYGWGLHRELQALVKAGLTPYQTLAAATTTPAAFLGATRAWGTVETGKRGDLVLLDANPLEQIENTMKISGVGIGGRWFSRADLDEMIGRGRAAVAVR